MAKRSDKKPTTPGPTRAQTSKNAPPRSSKGSGAASGKPGTSSKNLEISPIARAALENAGMPKSPLDQKSEKKLSKGQIDAIRKFAVNLAQADVDSGEDTVLICNRISEPPAIPLTELRYDRCRWCETEIYYDRLMPSPPGIMRVCVPCGIMLLEADKKGRN